ncbi:MAG: hypothetical protein SFU86_01310 [Pirellulaceae bacterium]|nr:hypothetical protein [Pirellulaceae bacterium]
MATSTLSGFDRPSPYPQSLLAGLRWRIRLYIWLEGLALAVIWLGLTFWFSLGLDYLPVLVGASEMPAVARGILLLITGAMLAWILYRYILSRTFVALADRSMALLLERKFAGFRDSLVTAVELSNSPEHANPFSRDLLYQTTDQAFAAAGDVRYGAVMNYARLLLLLAGAAGFAFSIGLFGGANLPAFTTAASRLYLLSSDPWPRSAHIEIVGIEVLRTAAPGQEAPRSITVPFEKGVVKVAKGSNVQLKVRADLAPKAKAVPQQCSVHYRAKAADGSRGDRGTVVMSSFRDTSEHRNFWFDNKPFKGILSTLEFDVVGYDHRLSGYKLQVVDSPAVVETLMDLSYPPYMVDEATSNYLPVRDQAYLPAGTFIPLGTDVTLKFRASKPLRRAEILATDTGERTEIDLSSVQGDARERFTFRIPALAASRTLEISLLDADNVTTERPYRVFLTGIEDQPPLIEVRLKGIGSAVTPDVLIPVLGKVGDDYAVAKTWFEVQVGESASRQLPVTLGQAGAVEAQIDFRQQRGEKDGLFIKPGDRLTLSIQASDKFDLSGGPHTGLGDKYELDVVTPEELLAQLEVKEGAMRRRFEQILDELVQMRDSLLRVKASLVPGAASSDPEDLRGDDDADGKPLSPEVKAQREAELRLLRVQRALQQSQKSLQEVQGVAAGFLDIRAELINNRLDTEDRKNRLKDQIADPLNKTCAEEFPILDQRLAALETQLTSLAAAAGKEAVATLADESIDQANVVLAQLEEVLAKMQDLETYNELLEIVRDLLKDQEKLIERTQQERKRQTLEELK